jgi:large subunit ribosomal protein L13
VSTYSAKPSDIVRKWHVVDAKGKILGRLATGIASILRGKHKPMFTPHMDTGDFVVVVNAESIQVTGNKMQDKLYFRHSNYPGGLKTITFEKLIKTHPERAIEAAVKGMLPHNRLGRKMIRKLKVYQGPDHPHQAQKPEPLELPE